MTQENESIFLLQAEKIISEIYNQFSENFFEKIQIKSYKDDFYSEENSSNQASLYSVIAREQLSSDLEEEKTSAFISDAIVEDGFIKFMVIYYDPRKEKLVQKYSDFCASLKESVFAYLIHEWKKNNFYFYNSSLFSIIIHNAIDNLVTEVSKKCCGYDDIALYENINLSLLNILSDLSYITYEKSNTEGLIYFTSELSDIDFQFRFDNCDGNILFSQKNLKMIRKLLELTNLKKGWGLISDTNRIYGIGSLKDESKGYSVTFLDDHEWILSRGEDELITMKDNSLVFENSRLSLTEFKPYLGEIFPSLDIENSDNASNILGIIKTLIKQDKGTILVVLKNAEKYIQRYKDLSILIEPVKLDEKNVEKLSSIDGAIIMDENCICYGFGVVLDGIDTGSGNKARGSRYNSSERFYHYCKEEDKEELFVFILSDDGNFNFFPSMK